MNKISFGVSGIPKSTKNSNYINGLKRIDELNLDAFELAFVRFINMSEKTADEFLTIRNEISEKSGREIKISVHAPYFINLNAEDPAKVKVSIERVAKAAHRAYLAGARNIVFHPGFYVKSTNGEALKRVKESMGELIKYTQELMGNDFKNIVFRPETTGKLNQFGKVKELIDICNTFNGVLPCIDFSHLHALNGQNNTYDEFISILQRFRDEIGDRAIKDIHIHYSGIEFSEKGERKHLPITSSDANYKDFLRALKDMNVEGSVICESPDLEDDALLLKEYFLSL